MEFRHLSQKFYTDYPQSKYPELMAKLDRAYCAYSTLQYFEKYI